MRTSSRRRPASKSFLKALAKSRDEERDYPRMRGFFSALTPEQQKAAMEYRGPENFGGPALRRFAAEEE